MAAPDACALANAVILSRLRGDPPWRSRVPVTVKKLKVTDVHEKANKEAKKQRALLKFGVMCNARKKAAAKLAVAKLAKLAEFEEIEFQKLYE